MKVLRVTKTVDPTAGGVAEAVLQTSRLLSTDLARLIILTVDHPESDFIDDIGLNVYGFGPSKYGFGYSKNLKCWLEENLETFDCVLIDGIWQYPSHIASTIAKKKNVPYFVFPHGTLDPWFQKISERGLFKPVRNWIYWHLIAKHFINHADALFYTCEQEKNLAATTYPGFKPRAEKVVGLGTSQPPVFKEEFSISFEKECPDIARKPYLLYLSRIDPKKGVDLLVKAYAGYLKTALEENKEPLRLVIAGPGIESSYGRSIKSLAETLPLDCVGVPYACFPGMLQGAAKWGAFYGCEAFILPSHQENFGIVVAEALGCGKPVLISNQVNIWREIEASGAGFVEDDTLEGCKRLLLSWSELANPDRTKMQDQAKLCFENNFRVESSVATILEILRNIKHAQ